MNETLEDGEYDYADVSDVDYGASATTAPIAPTAPSIPVCTHDGFVLAAYLAAVERESVRALEEDGVPTAAAAARVGRLLWRYTDELTAMDRYLNSVLATRPAEQQQQQQQRTEATGGPLTTSAAALIAQRFHVLARRAVHMFRVDARLLACRPSTQALSTPTAPDASAGTLEETLEGSSHIDTSALVEWFVANALSPYASKEQTLQLAGQTGLTFTQVRAWLIHMRCRRWRPLVRDVFNQPASGNHVAAKAPVESLLPLRSCTAPRTRPCAAPPRTRGIRLPGLGACCTSGSRFATRTP